MRKIRLWMAGAIAVATLPATGWAGEFDNLAQPASVVSAAWLGGADVTLTSCDSACGADVSDACAPSSCGTCCDPCCSCCEGPISRCLAWRPFKPVRAGLEQSLGIKTGGWVQAGITVNAEDPADNFNGPLLTNDRHGDVQMNELWLYAHRPIDTGGCGFDVGGRVDILYGTDWRAAYFHGFGLEGDLAGAKLNPSNELYGLSFAQFYAEFGLNDLSVKVGRMTGILGYEIVPPMGNFFYSHSYALCYGEPILITGMMADYNVADRLHLLGGFHQGVHRFEDNNGQLNFQGGIMWTSPDERLSLAYALDVGRNDFIFNLEDEYLHSLVMKYQLSPKLLYVLQNDLGWADGAGANPGAQWYGINQYLMYTLNEKWGAGIRAEWFRDDDGTRVLGLGNLDVQGWSPPSGSAGGYAGSFSEVTLGVNWKPKANILVRPEVRWDTYDGPANGAGRLPFDAGNSDSQFTFATDVVVMF